jgi:hypothetical protein
MAAHHIHGSMESWRSESSHSTCGSSEAAAFICGSYVDRGPFSSGLQVLAGLAFREAKRRSLLAFAVFVLPLMALGVLAVMAGI